MELKIKPLKFYEGPRLCTVVINAFTLVLDESMVNKFNEWASQQWEGFKLITLPQEPANNRPE